MNNPDAAAPAVGPGGRLARLLALAGPPLAWLTGIVNVRLLGGSFDWLSFGIGAVGALLMATLIARMLREPVSHRDLFALLGLATLPWLAGLVRTLAVSKSALTSGSITGLASYGASAAAGAQGSFLSWSLLGSAVFALTVATFIRRIRPVHFSDGVLTALAVIPVIGFAAIAFRGADLGPFKPSVIANPVTALFLLPFVGAATRRTADDSTVRPALGAAFAFTLAFMATVSFSYGVGLVRLITALDTTAGVGTGAIQAGLAELGRIRLLPLWAFVFGLIPAAAIGWQLRRSGRAVRPGAEALLVLALPLAQLLLTAPTHSMLNRLATVAATISAPTSVPEPVAPESDSLRRPAGVAGGVGVAEAVPEGVVGGVIGGVVGGARGGVPGGASERRPEAPRVTSAPVLIAKVAPNYPAIAKQAGVAGTVTLAVEIDSTGRVVSTTTLNGHPLLVPAAIAAIRQWRYRPALENGRPVSAKRIENVSFEP